jgi:hypothetical protein
VADVKVIPAKKVRRLLVGGTNENRRVDLSVIHWNLCTWNNDLRRKLVMNESPVIASIQESRIEIQDLDKYVAINA